MKNKIMKQRQLDRDAGNLAGTIVFTTVFLPLFVVMASPIFDYFDPSGIAFLAGLYLVSIGGFIWSWRKIAKFYAARDDGESE